MYSRTCCGHAIAQDACRTYLLALVITAVPHRTAARGDRYCTLRDCSDHPMGLTVAMLGLLDDQVKVALGITEDSETGFAGGAPFLFLGQTGIIFKSCGDFPGLTGRAPGYPRSFRLSRSGERRRPVPRSPAFLFLEGSCRWLTGVHVHAGGRAFPSVTLRFGSEATDDRFAVPFVPHRDWSRPRLPPVQLHRGLERHRGRRSEHRGR